MSVRNIRNHQSRGLLPPPEVRARTGYYGERARRAPAPHPGDAGRGLQAQRDRAADRRDGGADRFVGLRRVIQAPFETESPEILTAEELAERFGPTDERVLAKAQKLGLLVPLGDGRFEAPSPALLRAAEEVIGARHPAAGGARGDREGPAQLQGRVARLRQALPRRAVEAVRRGRPARRALARDHRVDRAPAPDRLGGAARHLQADDGARGRGGVRQGAGAPGQGPPLVHEDLEQHDGAPKGDRDGRRNGSPTQA